MTTLNFGRTLADWRMCLHAVISEPGACMLCDVPLGACKMGAGQAAEERQLHRLAMLRCSHYCCKNRSMLIL